MVLNKLKSNHTINLLLFPLLAIVFWLKNLLAPQQHLFTPAETQNFLFSIIYGWLKEFPFWQNVTALALFLFIAFEVLQISTRFNFVRIRTMLSATLFVLIAGGFTGMHFLHPVYFGAVFFLVALYRLFSAYDQPQPYSAAFDTGFFLGISILFYMNLLVLLPAFLIGIGILSRETRWREYVILIIGFLLPYIFTASYAYLTGRIIKLYDLVWLIFLTPNEFLQPGIYLYVYTGFLILLTLLGSIKILQQYDFVKVSIRKYFVVFFLIFASTLLSILLIPVIAQEMLLITVIPVTFLISNYFVFMKSRFWGNFWFFLLVVMVASMQIISLINTPG
jgi:hypothetical protein